MTVIGSLGSLTATRTPGLSARNSELGNYSRHKLSENAVRPVDNDEMMAALEPHEVLVRRFDGREILLREIDWSRLITCPMEEEERNFNVSPREGRSTVSSFS